MNFQLVRVEQDAFSTKGMILDDKGFTLCLTLERAASGVEPCIPAGAYHLRFKKIGESHFDTAYKKIVGLGFEGMPQVCDVPGREQILIHCGNTVDDSRGCIEAGGQIVASTEGFKIMGGTSQPAYRHLYPILLNAVKSGPVTLTITDPVAPAVA